MKSNNTTVVNRTGVGFLGLLTLLFIALKLTGVIGWSWVWVLAPLWIGFGIGLVVYALVIGVVVYALSR